MQSSWWLVRQSSGAVELETRQIPIPEPGPGEIRVKIRAVSLNHLDLWVRRGVEGHEFPLPLIGGCDAAVEVDAIGLGQSPATEVQVGDKGLIYPVIACHQCSACLRDRPELCAKFGIRGESQDGFLCQYQNVPTDAFVRIPPRSAMSLAEWSTLPIAGITAWSLVDRESELRAGDWILVHAAGSGVSHFAIPLAKARGARVVTTARGPEKCAAAAALGADFVIDSGAGDFRKKLREILKREAPGRRGVDVLLDHVGEATFSESMKCLEWGGRLLTCGATTGGNVTLDLKPVFFKSLSIRGVTIGPQKSLVALMKWVADGEFRPQIAAEFSFDQVPEAYDFLESHRAFGKVVVHLP